MEKTRGIRRLMQYGYELDAFDKYRDAVVRHNRMGLKVLSMLGFLTAVGVTVPLFTGRHPGAWIWGLLMLASSVFTYMTAKRETSGRGMILFAGYVLWSAFYAVAIYGNVISGREAYWVGINVALGCYLLDYSIRMFAFQTASFLALIFAIILSSGEISGQRALVSAVFLIVGMITVYALGRARLGLIMSREVTRIQAETDQLTGLLNRTAAEEEIGGLLRGGEETDVMMLLDLDHFKSVNDRMGHQMGDKVLVDVAAELKKMFRSTDVLSRLGGDEYIIFMHDVPEPEWVRQRAEQVVKIVRRWVTDGTTNVRVTASVGVVSTEGMEREYGVLYRAADIAMYFAKEQGGNGAVFYSRELLNQDRGAAERADELR
jgi:diguanylate cyclase (GGDEF)-like protein